MGEDGEWQNKTLQNEWGKTAQGKKGINKHFKLISFFGETHTAAKEQYVCPGQMAGRKHESSPPFTRTQTHTYYRYNGICSYKEAYQQEEREKRTEKNDNRVVALPKIIRVKDEIDCVRVLVMSFSTFLCDCCCCSCFFLSNMLNRSQRKTAS